MALTLKLNEPYVIEALHSGMTKTAKPFQFLVIKEVKKTEKGEKYAKKIKVWVDNCPIPVEKGDSVSIESISSVTYGSEKEYNGDRWFDAVSINARCMPVTGKQTKLGDAPTFTEYEADGDLPF